MAAGWTRHIQSRGSFPGDGEHRDVARISMPALHCTRKGTPTHFGQAFRLGEASQTGPEQLVLDDKVKRHGLLVPQHLVDELGQLEPPPVAGHHVL